MKARSTFRRGVAVVLSLAVSQVAVPAAQAAEHLLDSRTLAARLVEAAQTRDERIALFQEALGRPEVRRQARAQGVSAEGLSRALPHLSDAELQDLASRAARAQDVVAGHSTNDGAVIVGLVLLVAAVVALVAVAGYSDYYDECYCY